MIEKYNGLEIDVYEDIAELPIRRFQKFNKLMLIDAGLGSDIGDTDLHLQKLRAFIERGEQKHALQELDNLRAQVNFVQENVSPRHLAFAVLVKSIDGKERDDISDLGLEETRQMLSNERVSLLQRLLERAKKKIDDDLLLYFPSIFNDTAIIDYYNILKRRTVLELRALSNGEPTPPEVVNLAGELLTFAKPQNFAGSEGAEVRYDTQFESMCLMLTQALNGRDVKEMSVIEYYNAVMYVQEQRKEANKTKSRRR